MSRAMWAQARVEIVLTLRRGESLLLTLGIPLIVLGFFSTVDVLPTDSVAEHPVDFLVPGVLALATLSTAMVGIAIATGFERQYLVLKRLGATPLGRRGLLGAKTVSILAVEALQIVVIGTAGFALGWRPDLGALPAALAALVIASVAFAGLGFWMAGALPAEVTLGAANGLWLVFLLLGGIVVPLPELPSALRWLAEMLPAAAVSDVLHGTIGAAAVVPARAWIVLVTWAVAMPPIAAWRFRWE